jgi:hypothetical protein
VNTANTDPIIRIRVVVNPAKPFSAFDCNLASYLAFIQSPEQKLSFLNSFYPVAFAELATKRL